MRHAIDASTVWSLRVQNGEEIGRVYNLSNLLKFKGKNILTIGWFNDEDPFTDDIGINEHFTQYISNYHATLEYHTQECRWYIKDGQFREKNGAMGWYPSTNGVLLDGRRVSPEGAILNPDDILTIGDTTLKVLIN